MIRHEEEERRFKEKGKVIEIWSSLTVKPLLCVRSLADPKNVLFLFRKHREEIRIEIINNELVTKRKLTFHEIEYITEHFLDN